MLKNENIINNDDEILKTHRVEIESELQKQFREEYQKKKKKVKKPLTLF